MLSEFELYLVHLKALDLGFEFLPQALCKNDPCFLKRMAPKCPLRSDMVPGEYSGTMERNGKGPMRK